MEPTVDTIEPSMVEADGDSQSGGKKQEGELRQRKVDADADFEGYLLRYRRLFETAKDGILMVDAKTGEVTDANPYLLSLLGYTHEELLGKLLWEICPFSDIAANRDEFRTLQETELVRYEHLPLETKHGSRVDVEFVSNVYEVGTERVIQCNVRDISARKELEQQRTDFLAMLTHDIRNPLSVIYGNVDMLRDIDLVPEAREFVSSIGLSAQTVLALVTNYLDLSKIDLGQLALTKEPVVLSELLKRLLEPHRTEASARNITITDEFDDTLPPVDADPLALERMIGNLLHNALKFTPDGGEIRIDLRREGDRVAVVVTNTGAGIAADELPLLFRRYRQTATGRTRKGSGLGLFIVKSLAEAHGGSVEVESEAGRETRFAVFLPFTSPDAAS